MIAGWGALECNLFGGMKLGIKPLPLLWWWTASRRSE